MDKNVEQNKTQQSRRKFLLGAAKVAPVVTTMASMPVWASNASISGNLSGNVSGRTHGIVQFDGYSSAQLAEQSDPVNNLLDSTEYNLRFRDIFTHSGTGARVRDILNQNVNNFDRSDKVVDRLSLTAYYNAVLLYTPNDSTGFPYSPEEIIDFHQYVASMSGMEDQNAIDILSRITSGMV